MARRVREAKPHELEQLIEQRTSLHPRTIQHVLSVIESLGGRIVNVTVVEETAIATADAKDFDDLRAEKDKS